MRSKPEPLAHCVDCGRTQVETLCGADMNGHPPGWVCGNCRCVRQEGDIAWAAEHGGALMQRVDPDGPPQPCGCRGCTSDAVWVISVNIGTPAYRVVSGCDEHVDVMRNAAESLAKVATE